MVSGLLSFCGLVTLNIYWLFYSTIVYKNVGKILFSLARFKSLSINDHLKQAKYYKDQSLEQDTDQSFVYS